ncbi:MAG: TolC family protein [Cycloclasticus sp.]
MTIRSHIRRGLAISIFASSAWLAQTALAETIKTDASSYIQQNATLHNWLNKNVDNNPSVLAALSAIDSAGFQQVAASKALYNPELELDTESVDDVNTTTLGISQTIDWGDSRGAKSSYANSQRLLADMAFQSTQRRIALELLASLSELYTAEALKSLAEQSDSLMQRFATLAKQRFDTGDLGRVNVDLAMLSSAQARFKLADAMSQQVRARQNLMALTGVTNSELPKMPTHFPDPQSQSLDVDSTVQQLPQMLEATAAVQLAQDNIKVQLGQGVAKPTVALRAGREESAEVLGLTFSMPFQVRNTFRAEVDAANAQMIQAEREANGVYRALKNRFEIADASYDLSRGAWLFWETSVANTLNEQILLLERLWKAGELNTTDYLIQLSQALETKASAIQQRGHLWTDWSEWLIATGRIQHWLLNNAGEK